MDSANTTPLISSGSAEETPDQRDENAGQGMGFAIIFLILIGLIVTFFSPGIYTRNGSVAGFVAAGLIFLLAIAIAAAIVFEMAFASDYNLKPNVKKLAVMTLMSLCIMFLIWFIMAVSSKEAYETITKEDPDRREGVSFQRIYVASGAVFLYFMAYCFFCVLSVLSLVFAGLFTFGRSCCARNN